MKRSSGFPSCAGLLKNHSILLKKVMLYCFIFKNIGSQSTSSFCLIYLPRITTIDRWYVNVAVGDFLGIRIRMWSYHFTPLSTLCWLWNDFSLFLNENNDWNFMEAKNRITPYRICEQLARKIKRRIQTPQSAILWKTQKFTFHLLTKSNRCEDLQKRELQKCFYKYKNSK